VKNKDFFILLENIVHTHARNKTIRILLFFGKKIIHVQGKIHENKDTFSFGKTIIHIQGKIHEK
jgi:hypothetical protein